MTCGAEFFFVSFAFVGLFTAMGDETYECPLAKQAATGGERLLDDRRSSPFVSTCAKGDVGRGGNCTSSNECLPSEFCHAGTGVCTPFCEEGAFERDEEAFACDHCLQSSCPHVTESKCFRVKGIRKEEPNISNPCEMINALKHCPHCNSSCEKLRGITRGVEDKPRNEDVWIVSYPKAGNTWVRHLVSNLYRAAYDESAKGYVTFEEVDRYIPFLEDDRAWAARGMFRDMKEPRLFKTHMPWNCDTYPCNNVVHDTAAIQCHCPACAHHFKRVIYVFRNGEDTVASYYRFLPSIRAAFRKFTFGEFINKRRMYPGLSWSDHIRSWKYAAEQGKVEVLWLRYEDLVSNPRREVLRIAAFLQVDASEDSIDFAINGSSMEHLRKMEAQQEGLPFYKMRYKKATAFNFVNSNSNDQNSTANLWARIGKEHKDSWNLHNAHVMGCLGYVASENRENAVFNHDEDVRTLHFERTSSVDL